MNLFQLIGIAMCAVAVSAAVKQLNPAYSVYVSLACTVLLTYFAFLFFKPVIEYASFVAENSGMGDYASVVMRLLAIGVITGIAADICADAGEKTIGNRVELLGKAASTVTVLPVLQSIISSVRDFLM